MHRTRTGGTEYLLEPAQGHIQVYYGGDTTKYLEGRKILFEYRRLFGVEEILGTDFGPVNPTALLMAGGQLRWPCS